MKLESLFNFLNSSGLHTFYPIGFPPSSSEACSAVDLTGGTVERAGVHKVFVKILTRETHPKLAIDKAYEIKEYLSSNLKGAFFDGKKVLKVEADNPAPLYVGFDDDLYTVSMNYTILLG
jgi:hypothetical protein